MFINVYIIKKKRSNEAGGGVGGIVVKNVYLCVSQRDGPRTPTHTPLMCSKIAPARRFVYYTKEKRLIKNHYKQAVAAKLNYKQLQPPIIVGWFEEGKKRRLWRNSLLPASTTLSSRLKNLNTT